MPSPSDYRELAGAGQGGRRVEALWSFYASSAGEHLVLPDGRMDLVSRFRLDRWGEVAGLGLAIVGPSQGPARVPVAAGDRFLGLRFRAGWGGACLGVEPGGLRDASLDGAEVAALLGDDVPALGRARTLGDLADALLAVGRRRAARGRLDARVARALDLLHLSGGRLSPGEAARLTGLAERTLRRRMAASVGLSFGAFAGVLRFQRTLRLLAPSPGPGLTLAQAALEGGYSDQAHMTREFRRHGGFTPGRRPPVALGSLPLAPEVAPLGRQVAGTFNPDPGRTG